MKKSLKNKISVLFIFSVLIILICLIGMIFFWSDTMKEDYGLVMMLGICMLAGIGILTDFILGKIFKNKWVLNIIELFIVLIFLYLIIQR